MNRGIILLTIAVFISSCSNEEFKGDVERLPFFGDPTFTPIWDEEEVEHYVSDFHVVNQSGDSISQSTFENTIYVADFFFTTCPGICPRMTKNMWKVQEAFKNDDEVLLISHSVTPERDSVPTLLNYGERKGVDPLKWHLVTGDRDEIYRMGRKEYFIEEDLGLEKTDNEFLHTENFVLIDKEKRIRGIYNGLNETSINHLISDIKKLKKEG